MQEIALTERSNPDTADIDLMDSSQIAKAINDEDKKVAAAVELQLNAIGKAIESIADAFLKGGRLAYFGAGTSGRLGVLDASEMPPTFGVDNKMVYGFIAGGDKALRLSVENAEDSEEYAEHDLKLFAPTSKDIIVGISASGNPKYALTVLKEAKKIGCTTIGITSNPQAAFKKFADIFINPLVGEEVVTGSSRLKSGTAQKMILNMLSTGAMIRIGKTYKNYMIDVRMSNAKLVDRGIRIVSEIAKIPYDSAKKYLQQSENSVRVATVMAVRKITRPEAEKLLEENRNILRRVI